MVERSDLILFGHRLIILMNPEIVNLYIERLLQEVDQLTKNKMLIETQMKYTQMQNAELQASLEKLKLEAEKQAKRSSKKEVNTSDTF
jgi:hypothetical protein